MADDDDDLNDFKLPPHSNEDADAQLDAKALKLVEDYVSSLNRSKNENSIRSDIRDNIVKLGIHSLAFQHELTAMKMMDQADRRDYMAGRRRMGRILSDKQQTLFPEELERIRKRKERAKEQAAKKAAAASGESPTDQERRLAADTNPRGNPDAGGAGKAKGRGKAKDGSGAKEARGAGRGKSAAQAAADRAEDAAEQAGRLREAQSASPGASPGQVMSAGAAKSDAALAESIAAQEQASGGALLDNAIDGMKSQSAIAQQKRDEAGVP